MGRRSKTCLKQASFNEPESHEFIRGSMSTFNSHHEGYAVIKEELDELWEEIRKRDGLRMKPLLKKEAVQVGAMALRFLVDLIL